MSHRGLKARVEARDTLVQYAEQAGTELRQQALAALSDGDLQVAEIVINRNHATVAALVENLRIYQAELHAQADELADSQARTEAVLARFSALFSSLPVAAMVVAFNGELHEFNARAATLFNFRQTRSSGRFLHRLVNPEQYQRAVRPSFHEARASGASMVESLDFLGEDGRHFRGELHVAALPGLGGDATPGGQFACVVIDRSEHFEDLSRQYEARRQIGELTDRLNVANEAGGIGIWDWDLAQQHLFFDARMCALLDMSAPPEGDLRAALQGRFEPADAARLEAALARSLAEHELLNVELRLAQSQPERWLHLSGRAQLDAASQAVRLVGCAWDCTVEKLAARLAAAKDSAELASRSKSAFLSRMSHELRTPLNAILGFSQLMRIEAEGGDLVVKPHRVALIEGAAQHLLELINEVLDVTRIEAGVLEIRMARHDLCELVRDCLPMLQGAAERAGVTLIDRSLASGPQWVLCDRLRLKEVLINLLSNAIKYNRRLGSVEVVVQPAREGVELVVADTGVGLDEAQLDRLFQPFDRLGAESSGVEGSGMGLFVSRRFVELMGGRIDIRSARGSGTTAAVWLQSGG